MDGEEGIAQQSQRADQIGIAATRSILAQAGIFAPVQAVFHTRPMITDILNPLRGRSGGRGTVADVVAGFIKRFALARSEMSDGQRTPGVGEIYLQGFDGHDLDAPGFLPPMTFLGYVKKGVGAVFCARCAWIVGWLPLTWSR